MHVLAFDTAGYDCAVVVGCAREERPELRVCRIERIGRGHADRLIPMIEAALAEAELTFAELGRIVVTTGPGSFTGVRIGVAAARALALALVIPAVGASGLTAQARAASRQGASGGTFAAVLNAGRDQVFIAAVDARSPAPLLPPTAMSVADAAERLRALPGPLRLTGAAGPLLTGALSGLRPEFVEVDGAAMLVETIDLALRAEPMEQPRPLYLRRPDAKPQLGGAVARA